MNRLNETDKESQQSFQTDPFLPLAIIRWEFWHYSKRILAEFDGNSSRILCEKNSELTPGDFL